MTDWREKAREIVLRKYGYNRCEWKPVRWYGGEMFADGPADDAAIKDITQALQEAVAEKDKEIKRLRGEKRAPVQGYSAGIPWSMHLRAYDVYCDKWGPQEALINLEGRNCRGGFGVRELDDFIPGWREELSIIVEKDKRIEELEKGVGLVNSFQQHLDKAVAAERERLKPWLRHKDSCEKNLAGPRFGKDFGTCGCGLDAVRGEDDAPS